MNIDQAVAGLNGGYVSVHTLYAVAWKEKNINNSQDYANAYVKAIESYWNDDKYILHARKELKLF